jgi:molybdate transport system permease protein
MRNWFEGLLLAAVGVSVSLMLCLLAAQVAYTGAAAPFSLLAQPDVLQAMRLSALTATLASLLALGLALPAGYALARWRFPGRSALECLLVIPTIMSPMALGVALVLMFRTAPGQWVEDHLLRFVFEVPGMILAQFFVAFALQVLILRATFSAQNPRLEHVARLLGCTPWQCFRRVSLPLARNGVLAALILGWARAAGDFGATSTIAGAVKGKTETMPISIYLSLASVSLDRAVALSIVLTLVSLLGYLAVYLVLRPRPS